MATFPREWAHGGSAIVGDTRHQLSSEFTLASRFLLQTGTAWVDYHIQNGGAYWAGVPCAVGSVLEPIQEKRMCSGTVRKTLAASVAIPRCTRGCQVHSSPTCAASELLRTRHGLTQGATILACTKVGGSGPHREGTLPRRSAEIASTADVYLSWLDHASCLG